jgi:polyadenylation factor subunit 2
MNNLATWPAHREAVRGLSFSPDDERFATASDGSTVRIWSFAESREEPILTGRVWDLQYIKWHPTTHWNYAHNAVRLWYWYRGKIALI